MTRPDMKPLQTYLRSIIFISNAEALSGDDMEIFKSLSNQALQSTQIIIAMIPILAVYPFLQKYFVKGIVLGSVKG
jgi:putative aldouronate transport system permease protein